MIQDKQLPQAKDIEELILGAILINPKSINQVLGILPSNSFFDTSNRTIYDSMLRLNGESKPIDLATVVNQLNSDGKLSTVGGASKVVELTNRVVSSDNIEYHSRIVLEKYIHRKVIEISHNTINNAYKSDSDALELLSGLSSDISSISLLTETTESENFTQHISSIVKDVYAAKDGKVINGIKTPLKSLNERFGGWQDSDLIIMAARPAMGKTALALQLASYPVFFEKKKIIMFSLEMSAKQLTARVLSQELEIPANRFTRDATYMDLKDLSSKLEEREWVYNNNFIIDDRAGLDVNQLVAKVKTSNLDAKIDMVVIDYLQLLVDKSVKGNREQEISSISRKLKGLAKDLNIPVIALSQLSRSVESRGGDKIPMLSDLRESGAIEQDADIVIFLHRPEYYGSTMDESGNSLEGKASIITAKYRAGGVGTDIVQFDKKFTKFRNEEADNYFDKNTIKPNEDFENIPF